MYFFAVSCYLYIAIRQLLSLSSHSCSGRSKTSLALVMFNIYLVSVTFLSNSLKKTEFMSGTIMMAISLTLDAWKPYQKFLSNKVCRVSMLMILLHPLKYPLLFSICWSQWRLPILSSVFKLIIKKLFYNHLLTFLLPLSPFLLIMLLYFKQN